jgi:3-oxo-5-alpha-steroid 4-dehydrogenase 1
MERQKRNEYKSDMTAETFHILCLIWGAVALIVFFLLLFVKAPYGRHVQKGWGPWLPNELGWILMEIPSFLIMLYFFLSDAHSSYASLLYLLWLLHYGHRTFVFPFRLKTRGKKIPLAIVGSAIFFNLVNAGLNGYYLASLERYTSEDFGSWNFFLGLFFFISGALINLKSDNVLLRLRKPGELGYRIPKGFLFEKVSCANHFGELVEWAGFALMAWNCPAGTFFLWTAANLIPRSLDHHKWYKDQFPEYPENRKAIIPWLL